MFDFHPSTVRTSWKSGRATLLKCLNMPWPTEPDRVLRKGGLFVAQIDLGDHSSYHLSYGPRDPSKLFECLKYPRWLWNIMRWNRSSYVNRLRKSEWLQLFQQKGFRVQHIEGRESEEISRLLPNLPYLHAYSREDAVTYAIIVCAGKT